MKLKNAFIFLLFGMLILPGLCFPGYYPGGVEKIQSISNIGVMISSEGDWISYLNEMGVKNKINSSNELQTLVITIVDIISNQLNSISQEMKDKKHGFSFKKIIPIVSHSGATFFNHTFSIQGLINSSDMIMSDFMQQEIDAVLEIRFLDSPFVIQGEHNTWIENKLRMYMVLKNIELDSQNQPVFNTIWADMRLITVDKFTPHILNSTKPQNSLSKYNEKYAKKMFKDQMEQAINSHLDELKVSTPGKIEFGIDYTLLMVPSLSGIAEAHNVLRNQYFGKDITTDYPHLSHGFEAYIDYKLPYSRLSMGINAHFSFDNQSEHILNSSFNYVDRMLNIQRQFYGIALKIKQKSGFIDVLSVQPAFFVANIDHSFQIWDGLTNDFNELSARGLGFAVFINLSSKSFGSSNLFVSTKFGISKVASFKNDIGMILYQKQENNHSVFYFADENSSLEPVIMADIYVGVSLGMKL